MIFNENEQKLIYEFIEGFIEFESEMEPELYKDDIEAAKELLEDNNFLKEEYSGRLQQFFEDQYCVAFVSEGVKEDYFTQEEIELFDKIIGISES